MFPQSFFVFQDTDMFGKVEECPLILGSWMSPDEAKVIHFYQIATRVTLCPQPSFSRCMTVVGSLPVDVNFDLLVKVMTYARFLHYKVTFRPM